jgi:hypothetical protein
MITNEIVLVEEQKQRQTCPTGTHNAVCAAVYDLGVQRGSNGWPDKRKLALIFEVEQKIAEGPLSGQPFRISKIVSASLSDKSTLTALLTAWYGHDPRKTVNGRTMFSLSSLVGKPCMLTVVHKRTPDGDVQAIVTVISAHMKGLDVLGSTFDATKAPEWVVRMQNQRLDVGLANAVGAKPTPEGGASAQPERGTPDAGGQLQQPTQPTQPAQPKQTEHSGTNGDASSTPSQAVEAATEMLGNDSSDADLFD